MRYVSYVCPYLVILTTLSILKKFGMYVIPLKSTPVPQILLSYTNNNKIFDAENYFKI
jgi:hypothetical protein